MRRLLPFAKKRPTVSVVRLSGVIAVAGSRGGGLNDAAIAPVLDKAFSKGKPSAVALVINSPGGSPAQSNLIASRIRRLAEEKNIPVLAFVEDVAASGGYYLATAADEIFVDIHSIVGSIGVISAGFGFSELIEKHGIERRVYTAGESKSMLDPFQPEKPEDLQRLKKLQEQIHKGFVDHVKSRRGPKLSEDAELFTGEVWVGQQSVETGLTDGVAHLAPKMKSMFGDKTKFRHYGPKRGLTHRLTAQLFGQMITEVSERSYWARFGL